MEDQTQVRQYPFDGEGMKYNYISHRYILTKDGVMEELGEDLDIWLDAGGDMNPSTLADRFLIRVSNVVYSYIYQYSMGEQWLEYILAKYPPLRDMVKEMLQTQLMYMLNNGDIGLYSGVNVAKGQVTDINGLRGSARIAPEVEDICDRTIYGLGYCLKYAGRLPCVPYENYHKGY